jgi:hypothetical protein
MATPADFNGTYLMNNDLSTLFKIDKDTTDFITVELNAGKDTLKLSYYTENGFEYSSYKGKAKKGFFETHFSNTRIYIPALTMVNVDRLRIGSGKESDLLIYHYKESFGWILFLSGGSAYDERANSFSKFNPSKSNFLIPYLDNNKWGFIDSTQQIVIKPDYDFVRLFNDGIAKVKSEGKWGLINEEGKKITEIKYDKIFSAEDTIMRVLLNNKVGYIDRNGIEIIPPEYDEIDSLNKERKYVKTKKGNKYGFATKNGILCSPIFEYVFFSSWVCKDAKNTTMYGNVGYKGERYLVIDGEYMYKYECGNEEIIILEDSKIKISELNKNE